MGGKSQCGASYTTSSSMRFNPHRKQALSCSRYIQGCSLEVPPMSGNVGPNGVAPLLEINHQASGRSTRFASQAPEALHDSLSDCPSPLTATVVYQKAWLAIRSYEGLFLLNLALSIPHSGLFPLSKEGGYQIDFARNALIERAKLIVVTRKRCVTHEARGQHLAPRSSNFSRRQLPRACWPCGAHV